MKEKHREISEELKQIAPELAKIKKQEHYSVPPRYFRELPDRIMKQINTAEQQASGIRPVYEAIVTALRRPRYALVAASVAALVITFIILPTDRTENDLLAKVTTDEAYAYVRENIDDYSAQELYAVDPDVDISVVGIGDMSNEELEEAYDMMLEDIDSESLEALF